MKTPRIAMECGQQTTRHLLFPTGRIRIRGRVLVERHAGNQDPSERQYGARLSVQMGDNRRAEAKVDDQTFSYCRDGKTT